MLKSKKLLFFVCFLVVCFPCLVLGAPGDLDITFNPPNGYTLYNGWNTDSYMGAAIQTDGKLLVTARSTGGGTSIAMMLRYEVGGVLDDTFGTNGVVNYESDQGNAGFRDVVIQSDGAIVTSGYTRTTADYLFLTARYHSEGVFDNTFGANGISTYDGGYGNAGARGVAIQADGKIVVSGGNFNGNDLDVVVLRYNPNGTLDSGFGANGVVTYDGGKGDDNGRRLALLNYKEIYNVAEPSSREIRTP